MSSFWASPQVDMALIVGTCVAIAAAVVGVFVVMRHQAFLGHSLGAVAATGGAGAGLLGLPLLWGFFAGALLAGVAVNRSGTQGGASDRTTGILLALSLGLAALFLYFTTQAPGSSSVPQSVLFGSLFTVGPADVSQAVASAALSLVLVAVGWRPLLLCSVTPGVARVQGAPVRAVGIVYVGALVAAAASVSLVVGALLSTALLIGPAAAAVRWTRSPQAAVALAAGLGMAITWLGIVLSYASYTWPPLHRGWPISFFIATGAIVCYGLARATGRRGGP